MPAYEMNHGLSIVIEPPVRFTVMSRLVKTTPVKLFRCDWIQQLSAPATETKRCVTVQFSADEGGGAFEVVGAVGVDCEGGTTAAARRDDKRRSREQDESHRVASFRTTRPILGPKSRHATRLLYAAGLVELEASLALGDDLRRRPAPCAGG